MDLSAYVPSWGDIERNLDQRFSALNQSVTMSDPSGSYTVRVVEGTKVWLDKTGAPLLDKLSDKYGQRFTYLASTKPMPSVYQTA